MPKLLFMIPCIVNLNQAMPVLFGPADNAVSASCVQPGENQRRVGGGLLQGRMPLGLRFMIGAAIHHQPRCAPRELKACGAPVARTVFERMLSVAVDNGLAFSGDQLLKPAGLAADNRYFAAGGLGDEIPTYVAG